MINGLRVDRSDLLLVRVGTNIGNWPVDWHLLLTMYWVLLLNRGVSELWVSWHLAIHLLIVSINEVRLRDNWLLLLSLLSCLELSLNLRNHILRVDSFALDLYKLSLQLGNLVVACFLFLLQLVLKPGDFLLCLHLGLLFVDSGLANLPLEFCLHLFLEFKGALQLLVLELQFKLAVHHVDIALPLLVQKSLLHFALLFLFQLLRLSEVLIALRFEFHPLFFDLFGLLLVFKFNAFDHLITLFLHFLLEASFFIFMTLHQFINLLLLFALVFLQNALNFVLIFVLLHHGLGQIHHLSHLGSVVVHFRD